MTSAQPLTTTSPKPAAAAAPRPAAPAAAPAPALKMVADGLALSPGTITTGPDGKPRVDLKGTTQVGQVPVSGKVQLSGEQTKAGMPAARATGAGTVDGVPVAGTAKVAPAVRTDRMAGAVVSGQGTIDRVPVVADANVGLGQLPSGKPGARIDGVGRVDGVPVSGQVDVAVAADPSGKPRADVTGDVTVAKVPVHGDLVVTPSQTATGQRAAHTVGTLTTPIQPGAKVNVDMTTAKGQNAGQDPRLQAVLAVGPEVFGAVRQAAAQSTATYIRTGRMPATGLGPEVEQGLAKLREMNRNGQMTGAVTVYVDICGLERHAAAGIDRAARATPWRRNAPVNRVGVRNWVMNLPAAQAKVRQEAHNAIQQTLRDVAAKSGGVVRFVQCRPGQTHGYGTYTAPGVTLRFDASTPNLVAVAK